MKTQLVAGKFEIQGEIAKGQTGTIYNGYDHERQQQVAIKIYHAHINGRPIRGQAFIEKSKPLLRIEHPNLIKIFKVEEEEGPVVCMELFDAPSLQQVIHTEGLLPVERMLLLAREIATVLVHLHFQGIIHGTLHPGHVLVGPHNQIKVLDLGLSWILMDILANCALDLLRPLPYLPPEIAKDELLNVSSDLYCLGFMMYDMVTKRVPYSGLPKTSIMGKLAFDQDDPDFDFPEEVPKTIRELIRQMTRNHSQHRLQDATHVLTILNQQLVKFLPDVSNTPGPPSEPRPANETPKAPIQIPVPQSDVKAPAPTLNQPPVISRPKNTTAFPRNLPVNLRKRFGLTIGTILLLAGVSMGHWQKEWLEIHVYPRAKEPTNPTRPLKRATNPPRNSFATIGTEVPESSTQTFSKEERQHLNSDGHQNHVFSSMTPQNSIRIEDPASSLNGLTSGKTPSRSSKTTTDEHIPISAQRPDPETGSAPEPSQALRPQEPSYRTNQPLDKMVVKKHLAPVAQPAATPKFPSPISKTTGQETSSKVTKKPHSFPELPSEPVPETVKDIPEPTPASLHAESIEKELDELLDALEAPETRTTHSLDNQISPLPASSALPLSESSQ